jgi:hypothetical protein
VNNQKFTGTDRWDDLLNNTIKEPINVHTGNIVIKDERALFNGKWKMFYSQNVQVKGKKTYELYDILKDPYETNDLSLDYPIVFNEMKSEIDNQVLWMNPPIINPVMMFLWGDRFVTTSRFVGSPWLERDYELKTPPHPIIENLIFIWILILANKFKVIGFIFALVALTLLTKKYKLSR